MEWEKLNKESLELLRNRKHFLVHCTWSSDNPFDIINHLDLDDLIGMIPEEKEYCWHSLEDSGEKYTDKDMLDIFHYFCLIDKPL